MNIVETRQTIEKIKRPKVGSHQLHSIFYQEFQTGNTARKINKCIRIRMEKAYHFFNLQFDYVHTKQLETYNANMKMNQRIQQSHKI